MEKMVRNNHVSTCSGKVRTHQKEEMGAFEIFLVFDRSRLRIVLRGIIR